MPINFPDAPTTGDTHTVGDKTWTFDGTAWTLVTGATADHGNLGGLADDDHTQYLLADGTRSATGTITATGFSGPLTGNVTGNADTATKLATARTITLGTDLSGSVSFDGSANVTLNATVADDSHNHITSNIDGLEEYIEDVVAGSLTAGSQITVTYDDVANTITLAHADTSTQASVNNSNGTVIQDVTVDGNGHVTALGSVDLDGRYYTETEADARFLRGDTSDTMSGTLTVTGGLAVDTNTLYVDSSTDRVGIGTTGPSFKLDVNGTAAFSNAVVSGNADVGGYLNVDTGTLYVDPTNNRVGIGTTSPQANLSVGTGYSTFSMGANDSTGFHWAKDASALNLYTGAIGSGTYRFGITTNGNVGIGVNPSYKLDVNGDINTTGSFRTDGKKTGLVLQASGDFTNASSVDILNVFTSEFDNYQIHFSNMTGTLQEWVYFRFWQGGSLNDGANYDNQRHYTHITSVGGQKDVTISYGKLLPVGGNPGAWVSHFSGPNLSNYSLVTSHGLYSDNTTLGYLEINNTFFRSTTAATGIRFGGVSGSGTISGRWEVYGCPK